MRFMEKGFELALHLSQLSIHKAGIWASKTSTFKEKFLPLPRASTRPLDLLSLQDKTSSDLSGVQDSLAFTLSKEMNSPLK